MTAREFIITDCNAGIHCDRLELDPVTVGPLGGTNDWLVRAETLRGGSSDGVQVVTIGNGPLELSLLPTRGMGVWKGRYRQLPLQWQSPVRRPVHPAFVNLHDRNGLGWLNGFNELMCRCGLAFNGPPGQDEGTDITLHGRIANLPAHRVIVRVDAEGPGTLEVIGEVHETTMFGPSLQLTSTVRMQAGSPRVEFVDEVTNFGGSATELSLLYHINIGRPFLDAGAENAIACQEIVPRDERSAEGIASHHGYGPPEPGFVEQAYFYRPAADASGWSTAVLHNSAKTAAFAVRYRADQLPCFTVWKNTQSEAEGYVTGLEPAVNFPNFRSYERQQGRLPKLAPGATYRSEMAWEIADSTAGVHTLLDRVQALQAGTSPRVHPSPQPGWSPAGG